jgi:hypothetical protein
MNKDIIETYRGYRFANLEYGSVSQEAAALLTLADVLQSIFAQKPDPEIRWSQPRPEPGQ